MWSLGTYFHPIFFTYPRLAITAERGCGKTKLLEILQAVSWNGMFMLSPTSPVLFRLVETHRPTILLDEMESVSREDKQGVLSILNAGYKRGATVPRVEGKETREVRSFSVYSPMALAGIKGVNPTTADRCIPVFLQRGIDRQLINAEIDPNSTAFTRIRSGCHRLLLTRFAEVKEAYEKVDLPDWLTARARELWKPLLALAQLSDAENDLGLEKDLLALAKEHVKDREGLSAEGEALFTVLEKLLDLSADMVVYPKELGEPLREHLGWKDAPSPVQVGSWLRRFRFPKAAPPKDRKGARYSITAEHLENVTVRYIPQSTVTPSPSQDKPLKNNECDGVTVSVTVGGGVTDEPSQDGQEPENDELFSHEAGEGTPEDVVDWGDRF